MATVCPYCNMEVRESAIEAEDGCCPECGAQITAASSFFDDPDSDFNDYDEMDDVFSDLDDEEDGGHDFSRRDLEDDDIFGDDDLDGEFDEDLDGEFDDDEMFDDDDEMFDDDEEDLSYVDDVEDDDIDDDEFDGKRKK